MKQPLHATIERWAIKRGEHYLKHKAFDTGYMLFETRREALEYQEHHKVDGFVVKVRLTIRPATP